MNADRINELYAGKIFAPETQMRARERIHWICRQAQGKKILDVGCSQGIVCLLLAREGFNCIGIDCEKAAIAYALEELKKEEDIVQKRVEFKMGDAVHLSFEDDSFDTVILGEILEHLNHPEKVLKEAKRVLKDGGIAIITVPFGLNLDPDHKRTYYPVPFLETVRPFFKTSMIDTINNYIIYCGIKDNSYDSADISREVLLAEELRLQIKTEERLLLKEQELFAKSKQFNEKVKTLTEQVSSLSKTNKDLKEAIAAKEREIKVQLVARKAELRSQEEIFKCAWKWRIGSFFVEGLILFRDFIRHPMVFMKEARRRIGTFYYSINPRALSDRKDAPGESSTPEIITYGGKEIHFRYVGYDQYLINLQEYLDRIKGLPVETPLVVIFSGTIYIQEERGNRPIRLTKTLLESGIPVLFSYFRWNNKEPVPDNYHEFLFQSPIDYTVEAMEMLCKRSVGDRMKVFVVSFPYPKVCRYLNQLNVNGWVTLYDARDDWEEFEKVGAAKWFDKSVEKYVINNCDATMAISRPLQAKLQAYTTSKKVLLCPNAYDRDFLKTERVEKKTRSGTKVAGYFGHLTDKWFDWKSLTEVADKLKDWKFEIIGHAEPDSLSLPPNVKLLGKKGHAEINKIASGWGVAMILFKINKLSEAVDPIKIYEYLALELPTVTFTMPQIHDYPYVYPSRSVEEFVKNLKLASGVNIDSDRVWDFLSYNRWEDRAEYLLKVSREAQERKSIIKEISRQ